MDESVATKYSQTFIKQLTLSFPLVIAKIMLNYNCKFAFKQYVGSIVSYNKKKILHTNNIDVYDRRKHNMTREELCRC